LRSHVLIPQGEPGLDLIIHGPRDTEAAPLRQALQPSRNVDSISIDALPLHDHIPKVDADAKFHAALERQRRISEVQFVLDGDRALYRVHHTGKLGQQVISR
jgi:hypothetical protein